MSFKIVTDTSCNLTYDLIKKYDIGLLSLAYVADGVEHPSSITEDNSEAKEFYARLRNREQVSSACINSFVAKEYLEKLAKAGTDFLYVSLSGPVSGSAENVQKAINELKEQYPEVKMLFVDSLTVSSAYGAMVVEAAKLREKGKKIDEVYKWLEENKLKACAFFTVDNLYWLKKGGRISGTLALIGTVLSLKPIIKMNNEGKPVSGGKKIGRKASIYGLAEIVAEKIENANNQTIYIGHGDCVEDAEILKAHIQKLVPDAKYFVLNYVEFIMGVHGGPGAVSVFFFGKDR